MSKKAPNPRKIPRTQADVDRAYQRGVMEGSDNASVIMMTVLLDKLSALDYVVPFWKDVAKLSQEVSEGRVSISDLRTVLREEYSVCN